MSIRAAIYTRISETDDKIDKVELQQQRLQKLALKSGYTIVDTYTDDGISGWSGKKRSEWDRLKLDIGLGRVDMVLADRQDRLTRSSAETEYFKILCVQHGVKWQFNGGSVLDPSDHMNAAMASFSGIMAQMESDIKKERLRARFEHETMQGMPLWGTRPFGYNKDRMTLEPTEAKELQWAYKQLLEGGSIYSIIKSWNNRGVLTSTGKQWSYATVQQMLKRPRNAGLVVRDGVVREGVQAQWEAVVTREQLEAATAILTDQKRRTAPGRKQAHLTAGLVHCAVCDAPMRSASVRLKGVLTPIYKCSTKAQVQTTTERHTTIQTNLLDPLAIEAVVSAFLMGPAALVPTDTHESPAPMEQELSKLRASRQRLIDLVAEDLITTGDAASQLSQIKKREGELEAELTELRAQSAQAAMAVDLRAGIFTPGARVSVEKAAEAKQALRERFMSLPLNQQRELVRTHLDIRVSPGRKLERVAITQKIVTSLND